MKTALLLTTYNRPEYLKRCLDSLRKAELNMPVIICDDCSTDSEALGLIDTFISRQEHGMVIYRKENGGIKKSLLDGYELTFNKIGADLIINLDSDAIVAPNCFTELIRLKIKYPDRIITGFHSTTKNKDGSERHIILEEWDDVYVKKSVGGINMIASKFDYENYIKPTLLVPGNWDHETSKRCEAAGKPVLSVKQSLVDHIGFISAMGHNHDQPDVAAGFKTKYLSSVTLCGADSRDPHSLKEAARISQQNIEFGAVKLFTDHQMMSKSDYSIFIMKQLYKHIDTSHLLIIQADGFVVNADAWNDEWLNYDYIGATWLYKDGMNVGNGGFSLRSKKLMQIIATDENIKPLATPHNEVLEDHCICRIYRDYLERTHGIRFAPAEVADKFAIEAYGCSGLPGANKYTGQFGFHSYDVDFSQKEGYKPYLITGKRRWKVVNYNGS